MKPGQILQLMFAAAMICFSYLQLNDPDPVLWVLVYVIVAGLLTFSAFGKRNIYAFWGIVVPMLITMGVLSPGVWHWMMYESAADLLGEMSPDRKYIEETREFGGLLIALILLIPVYMGIRKDKKNN